MRIAVYSGSFDPLHIGHLAILAYLNQHFDKVLLVVSPQNPFKGESKVSNSFERLEAARKVVKRHPELANVEVSDIEFTMSTPQYTYRTLEVIHEKYPFDEICLVIGGDNLAVFKHWRNYKHILLDYSVLVYPRIGFDSTELRNTLLEENPSYHITLADMPLVNISSTEIRETLSKGENIDKWLA